MVTPVKSPKSSAPAEPLAAALPDGAVDADAEALADGADDDAAAEAEADADALADGAADDAAAVGDGAADDGAVVGAADDGAVVGAADDGAAVGAAVGDGVAVAALHAARNAAPAPSSVPRRICRRETRSCASSSGVRGMSATSTLLDGSTRTRSQDDRPLYPFT
jgi:hypothetical protein